MTDAAQSSPHGDARDRAAAALRRLGHALVDRDADPALLDRIAELAHRTAATVEAGAARDRPIQLLKRRMWEQPPPSGERMRHFEECIVSGSANPMGAAIEVRREGDEAVADFTLGAAFEGAPQRAHGGVIAAVLDDVMGYVLSILRTPAYTGRLTVHYRAPAPLRVPLTARARLVGRDGRKLHLAAEIRPTRLTADAVTRVAPRPVRDGGVVAEGEGVFILIHKEQLDRPEP